MKAEIIYDGALRFLAESIDAEDNQDYRDRAPYILGAFCSQVRGIDSAARQIKGLNNSKINDIVYLDLDSNFPMLDELAPAAELYLAAMLVIDENSELSDTLYDKYCDNIASIAASLTANAESTATCEPIVQKYFFN